MDTSALGLFPPVFILEAVAVIALLAYLTYRKLTVGKKSRIESASEFARRARHEKKKKTNEAEMSKAEIKLKNAGLTIEPSAFLLIRIGAILLGLLAGFVFGGLMLALLGAACGLIAPEIFLRTKTTKRKAVFSEQLCAALPQIAENMRSGLTIESSIRNVANFMDDPLREEFRRVNTDLLYDITLPEAFENLAKRTGDKDVERLAAIIAVQKEGGGNLAVLLDIEAEHIEKRLEIRGNIKSITAQGRMQATVLSALPFGVLAVISIMNPAYPEFFFGNPLGLAVLGLVVLLELAGIFIMLKIYKIPIN